MILIRIIPVNNKYYQKILYIVINWLLQWHMKRSYKFRFIKVSDMKQLRNIYIYVYMYKPGKKLKHALYHLFYINDPTINIVGSRL